MSIKFVLKQIDSTASPTAVASVISEYDFDGSLFTIGSDNTNTIVVAGSAPEQAVVIQEGKSLTLINGAEGTIFNNLNLRREAIEPLNIGDEIRIGNYLISIVSDDAKLIENELTDFSTKPDFAPEINLPIAKISSEKNLIHEQSGNAELPEEKKPARNFADILNTLRTEEDSFYFIVRNGTEEEKSRIPLEQTEMPLGLDTKGEITCAVEQIAALYAIVRKDWSGIVIESQRGGTMLVNNEPISTTKRLRNRDRVNFNVPRKNSKNSFSLELHEPSSLVALESIMETRPGGNRISNGANNLPANNTDTLFVKETIPIIERRFFGYFNFFEVAVMLIGTLIAAVLIFLFLESAIG